MQTTNLKQGNLKPQALGLGKFNLTVYTTQVWVSDV